MLLRTFTILTITCLLCSCHKDLEIIHTTSTDDPPQVIVNTQLTGQVLDSEGFSQDDYSLIFNNTIVPIQSKHFLQQVFEAKKNGQYIELSQAGEFKGFANLLLMENDINYMNLHFFPQWTKEQITSKATIQLSPELSLELQGTKSEDNVSYTGTVQASYGNLNDKKYDLQVGTFGYDDRNNLASLLPLETFYLNLKDSNNIDLELEQGAKASYTNSISDQVALFRFEEESKKWKYASEFLNGTFEVLDDGYYMLAQYTAAIHAEGDLASNDKAISYQQFHWTNEFTSKLAYTTMKGQWHLVLPQSSAIDVELLNPCDETIFSTKVNTQTEPIKEESIVIDASNDGLYNLRTTVLDCEGDEVNDPTIHIIVNSADRLYTFQNASIDTWILVCENSFEVAAYDINNDISGPTFIWNTSYDRPIEYLTECQDYEDGYSYIKVRQDQRIYPSFSYSKENNKTILEAQDGEIKFIINASSVGELAQEKINIKINDNNLGPNGYFMSCENSTLGCGVDGFVSHYEELTDGWIRISFSGEIWAQTLAPAAAGSFPIEGVILCKIN